MSGEEVADTSPKLRRQRACRFRGGSGTELELETGTVGTVCPEIDTGTETVGTVLKETKPEPCFPLNRKRAEYCFESTVSEERTH